MQFLGARDMIVAIRVMVAGVVGRSGYNFSVPSLRDL